MKKYSWIAALLMVLTISVFFISCGEDYDATKLAPEPWAVDAKSVKLEKIGSNDGQEASGNTYTNKAGGGATSAGFVWKVGDLKNDAGFAWTDFANVRVTIKILELKQPAGGVSYNAKGGRTMNPDVNRVGETAQYKNADIVIGGVGAEGYADYPVAGFKDSGEIAFQYNVWEGISAIADAGGRESPNHKIEVNFMFYTTISEPAFVPVTGIEGVPDVIYATDTVIKLTGFKAVGGTTAEPKSPNYSDIVWKILDNHESDLDDNNNTAEADWIALDYSYNPPVEVQGLAAILLGSNQIRAFNDMSNGSKYTSAQFTEADDPRIGTYGQFTIRATVVSGNGIGADFTQDFTITVKEPPFPVFASPTINLGPGKDNSGAVTGGKWIFKTVAGADTNGTTAQIFAAKYLIVAGLVSAAANPAGYGGLQFALQGDGSNTGVNDWKGANDTKTTGDWVDFPHEVGDIDFFVFELSSFTQWTSLKDDASVTQVQFYVNSGGACFNAVSAYLSSDTALDTKPSDAADDFHGTSYGGTQYPISGKSYITQNVALTEE